MKSNFLFLSIVLITIFSSNPAIGQNEAKQKGLDAIDKESLKAQLEFLSSD
ncbi:MAG: hypothetical protein AB7S50_08575 [Bacteroidales bacterium]